MKIRFDRPEQRPAGLDQGVPVSYGRSRRRLAYWRWYLILLIICSSLLYFFIKIAYQAWAVQAKGFVMMPHVQVRATASGFIESLLVEPMQDIEKEELIVKLQQPSIEERKKQLQSELDFLQQQYDRYGEEDSAASAMQASIDFARKRKLYAWQRVEDYESLFAEGAATEAEVKTARFQYGAALASLAELQLLEEKQGGAARTVQASEIRQTEARIRQLQLEMENLDLQSRQLFITSPLPGRVVDILVSQGEFVAKGDLLLTINQQENATIVAFVAPEDIDYARVGQKAVIHFPDSEKAAAQVISVPGITKKYPVGSLATFESGSREILVKLEFSGRVDQHMIDGLLIKVAFSR